VSIGPAWAVELLADWGASDWRETRIALGMPAVCPSFKGLIEISTELELTGYSPAEVEAIAAAVEALQRDKPEHFRVLLRTFRPWARDLVPSKPGDNTLLAEAVQDIARRVDAALE
jgi:hypothetical protein